MDNDQDTHTNRIDPLTGEITGPDPDAAQEQAIQQVLAAWADYQAGYDLRRGEILARVQADLDALDAEFRPALDHLAEAVRQKVRAYGRSVRAAGAAATIVRPSPRVDVERLLGYAEAHPEVRNFIRYSEPQVRIIFKGMK